MSSIGMIKKYKNPTSNTNISLFNAFKWAFGVVLCTGTAHFSPLFAQKYSNAFLTIGAGARAHGMAGAQTAHVSDVTAGYWNPAGLAQVETPWQVAAMHAEWFAGVSQYDYLTVGRQLNAERGAFLSISLIRLGIDNIPYTINLVNPDGTVNYDNLSSFSAADYAMLGSYAYRLRNPAWSVGGTFKVIRRVIGRIGGAWGFGADAGIQYRKGRWQAGLTAFDLTTTFNAWSFSLTDQEKSVFKATGNELPTGGTEITRPRFVLGGGYRTQINQNLSILAATDLEITTDGQRNVLLSSKAFNAEPRLGVETDYKRRVQLRMGVGNFQRVKQDFDPTKKRLTLQPNLGVGLTLGRIQLDYALTDVGNVSQVLYSHLISARVDIGQQQRE